MTITFILQGTDLAGGTIIVHLLARTLARLGHEVWIVSATPPSHWFTTKGIHFRHLPDLDPEAFPKSDVGVATFWTTIKAVARSSRFAKRLHFCQGYEGDYPIYNEDAAAIETAYHVPMERVTVSDHLVPYLYSRFGHPVTSIGQAIDETHFHIPSKPRLAPPPHRVVLVGAGEADFKGIPFILETLRGYTPPVPMEIHHASPTPPMPFESEYGLIHTYYTALSPHEMGKLYRSGHILIHASDTCEGFGLPPIEAIASGCFPVMGAIPAYAEFPDALLTFPPRDGEALFRSLDYALTHPGKIAERMEVLMPYVRERFSSDCQARAFLEAVEKE